MIMITTQTCRIHRSAIIERRAAGDFTIMTTCLRSNEERTARHENKRGETRSKY